MTNIIQQEIASPPNNYEAYLYRYTNLIDLKVYVGIHKGSVDDSYNHSSTSSEFAKVFTNPNSELKYEVIQYGSFQEMKTAEYNILTKGRKENKSAYYNKHSGAPAYVETDLNKIKFLVKQISDGVYPVEKEDLSLHEDMSYLQVRFQNNPELQKVIKERIDDAKGNTDKCNPLIVCEGRTIDGDDQRIDGSHTCFGAAQSKHAHDIPVMRIPYDVHVEFTDSELKRVANLCNKIGEVVKGPISQQDAIKDILDNNQQGVPYNSNNNVNYLNECGFTGSGSYGQISRILSKAKQLIDEDKAQTKSNQLFIKYKAKPHSDILDTRVKTLGQKENCCATYMSSAKLSVERILETLYANRKDTNKIFVVIHHPTVEWGKKWKKTIQPLWMNILETLLKEEIDVEFDEMEMWMNDGTKK